MGRHKRGTVDLPSYQVEPETITKLRDLAIELGYRHGKTAAMGAFLGMIANLDPDLLKIIAEKSQKIQQSP